MLKKKFIIYTGGFILPDGNAAAHRVLSNAKILRNLGYEVIFLGDHFADINDNKDRKFQTVSNFKSYSFVYPSSINSWITHLSSIKKIKDLIKQLGVENVSGVIAYNYPALALLRLYKYCKKNKIKTIADSTEWQIVKRKSRAISILKNMDTFLRMKIVHKKVDGLIVISSFLFDFYKAFVKNILLLPPLVDPSEAKWSQKTSNSSIQKKLIYAGSPGHGEKDRLDKIINSLSIIFIKYNIDFKLTIVGLTKSQFIDSFGASSLPENISNKIIFKGRLSHLETLKIIQESDYSIFFRDNNLITRAGFPTKLVESISCGIPVLTNSSSNILDYLKNDHFGFIIDTDSESSLNTSLHKALILSIEQLNRLKNNCRNSKDFDLNSYKNGMQNFLIDIFDDKNLKLSIE